MPIIRLLIPFLLGIVLQYYWPNRVTILQGLAMISTGTMLLFLFPVLNLSSRYKSGFINGLSSFILFAVLGCLTVWQQDIRLHPLWAGNIYKENDAWIIKLRESPVEKSKSLKARASITNFLRNDTLLPAEGNLLLYFLKDSSLPALAAGDELLVRSSLQAIPASANPGGFDFQRYCLFQGTTHQAFLRPGDFVVTRHQPSLLQKWLSYTRAWVLSALSTAFPEKKERGLAEALLIGYKDDLDKTLVQSYTNTGVVHIIAISGLHLGLIYWLLVKLLQPLKRSRHTKLLSPLLIIGGLWFFALLAGAQPSVLRSALMFTCIAAGESLSRKSNIYNSLALSAFLLLCYNPYWLWDAGFQLSYAAILGIVVFMKPIYQLFSISNKLLDNLWQLNAVTLSAQILTIPVCLYHFHQFPVYFLLSNFIAVPLSSLILLAEILICCTSFLPAITMITGKATAFLIRFMNTYIERVEALPFSVWGGIQINFVQALLLTAFLLAGSSWFFLKKRNRLAWYASLASLAAFLLLRSDSFIHANNQRMIIVYQQTADFVFRRQYVSVPSEASPNPLYTEASRSFFRLQPSNVVPGFDTSGNYVSFLSKRIILLNGQTFYRSALKKQRADLLILSQNPSQEPSYLHGVLDISQVVADATVPAWKLRRWKQQCDSLQIPFHDVRTKGAFVMNL